jgi:hypothetical protein
MQCPFLELIADSTAENAIPNDGSNDGLVQSQYQTKARVAASVDEFLIDYRPDEESLKDFFSVPGSTTQNSSRTMESISSHALHKIEISNGRETGASNNFLLLKDQSERSDTGSKTADCNEGRKRKRSETPTSQELSEEKKQRRRDQNREAQRRFRERHYSFQLPQNSIHQLWPAFRLHY